MKFRDKLVDGRAMLRKKPEFCKEKVLKTVNFIPLFNASPFSLNLEGNTSLLSAGTASYLSHFPSPRKSGWVAPGFQRR
jgi:hypothetical protein